MNESFRVVDTSALAGGIVGVEKLYLKMSNIFLAGMHY